MYGHALHLATAAAATPSATLPCTNLKVSSPVHIKCALPLATCIAQRVEHTCILQEDESGNPKMPEGPAIDPKHDPLVLAAVGGHLDVVTQLEELHMLCSPCAAKEAAKSNQTAVIQHLAGGTAKLVLQVGVGNTNLVPRLGAAGGQGTLMWSGGNAHGCAAQARQCCLTVRSKHVMDRCIGDSNTSTRLDVQGRVLAT